MAIKNKPEVRYALWQAYQRRCAICHEDLFNYSDLEIDHIIAESKGKDPEVLREILKKYSLPSNFDLNSLENLRPSHHKCNNKKRDNELPDEITANLLRTARNKLKDVEKQIKRFEEDAKYALNVEAIRRHLNDGKITLEEYTDQINNYIADFGDEEYKSPNDISSYIMYKKRTVKLEGYLPKVKEPKGSCLFTFNSFYIRGTVISMGHQEILKTLYPGHYTPIEYEMRNFIIARLEDEDSYIIQLGNSRFTLNTDEVVNLCTVIDEFVANYVNALQNIEQTLESKYFNPHKYNLSNYHLIKIRKDTWNAILNLIKEYDFENGNTKWHIFDVSGNNMLKVYYKNKTENYDEGYKCMIHSFIEEPYSWEPSEYVWLIWWDINRDSKYELRGHWNVYQTYKWLTKEFLPFAIYNISKPYKHSKIFFKKRSSFNEFKEKININEYYFDVKNRHFSVEQINNRGDLLNLIQELSIFYSISEQVCIKKSDLYNIYNSLILSLNQCSKPDYHYICSKLGINSKEKTKEEIIGIINREKVNLENNDNMKISGNKLDILFRILFVNINATENQNLNIDEMKNYVNLLKTFIDEFNISKLVDKYLGD